MIQPIKGQNPMAGSYEHGKVPSISIQGGEFPGQMSD
jgi:hypothetical protein